MVIHAHSPKPPKGWLVGWQRIACRPLNPLKQLVSRLPAELPAAICIAQHISVDSSGSLADIIARDAHLPTALDTDRMPLNWGPLWWLRPTATSSSNADMCGVRAARAKTCTGQPSIRCSARRLRPMAAVIGVVLTGMLWDHPADLDTMGRRSVFSCPKCDGVLWELDDEAVLRYRCHVGHAFTVDTLRLGQATLQERAVCAAVRSLEKQATC